MGTIGRAMDAAFIDRDDPASAVESLHQVEELARKGLSIVIAPEGTRIDTTEVGPFKKGAFRIAMAVGIPIVPIVIRNAEIVAARNSTTINPGTVDVAVFPPISVRDWTVETLPERIAEVRQLYLDTLANWPAGELPKIGPYAKKAGKATKQSPAAKKTAAKKVAPKKAVAKKVPAKKVPAKKAPAKAARKAVANKAATKAAPDNAAETPGERP
jgi:putative phosphoserine phosphatase/1-acylglycerol-3-phosphate O-acyltransferase